MIVRINRWDEYKAEYPHIDNEAIALLKRADEKMLDLVAQIEWPTEMLVKPVNADQQ